VPVAFDAPHFETYISIVRYANPGRWDDGHEEATLVLPGRRGRRGPPVGATLRQRGLRPALLSGRGPFPETRCRIARQTLRQPRGRLGDAGRSHGGGGHGRGPAAATRSRPALAGRPAPAAVGELLSRGRLEAGGRWKVEGEEWLNRKSPRNTKATTPFRKHHFFGDAGGGGIFHLPLASPSFNSCTTSLMARSSWSSVPAYSRAGSLSTTMSGSTP
jgi:hypothetical protein